MAWRPGEYVVYAEIRNLDHYTTTGVLVLRSGTPGKEPVIRFELTGDCAPDLQGKIVRIWPEETSTPGPVWDDEKCARIQDRQIGPTGTITAEGWCKIFECSVEEYLKRAHLGEPPPLTWKRRLQLEWYGQNGRVMVELAGPRIEVLTNPEEERADEANGRWVPLPHHTPHPDAGEPPPPTGLGIVAVYADGTAEKLDPEQRLEEDDPYGLIPPELQNAWDSEAASIDRSIDLEEDQEEDDRESDRELELFDQCLESGEGVPIYELLGRKGGFPSSADLSDDAVEQELKGILASLAIFGVALDVCKHFSPRQCYDLLVNEILPDSHAYRELAGTGWVQHHATHEYCPQCDAEYEALDNEKRPTLHRPPEGLDDSDSPF